MNPNFNKRDKKNKRTHRINDEITERGAVRVIYKSKDATDDFNKVMDIEEARRLAERKELDLIEINGKTSPIILRMEEYSRFIYEEKKREKERKQNQSKSALKEIQLSTNISDHDMSIKMGKAKEFIEDGNKVKLVLTMRGRELGRREQSKIAFYRFIDMISDVAVPEGKISDVGNKAIVILKRKN